jgi:lysophospholipase L1-like esterase
VLDVASARQEKWRASSSSSNPLNTPHLLRKPGLLLPLLLVSGALLELALFWRGVGRARSLAAQGRRFERRLAAQGTTILILGDSTGVGVGARLPEESIAGLLAADFPNADIVNVSESGARIADTVAQASKCNASGWHFDMAVLHVGGNDIVQATSTDKLTESCEALMQELSRLAHRTVWLGPPNLGWAPLFPPPYSWLMAARSRVASAVFARSAAQHGVAFVDFSAPMHAIHFGKRRRQHFASDGFHPNSSSYRYGYAAARQAMELAPSR